jgi:hypothetical protein
MATGGRKTQYQVIHELSAALAISTPPSVLVGVIPSGAVLDQVHLNVSTVFNSTTNTVALGTTPGGNNLLGATTLAALGRTDTPVASALMGPWVGDTPIYATLAQTGGAPTTGAGVIWLSYLPGIG